MPFPQFIRLFLVLILPVSLYANKEHQKKLITLEQIENFYTSRGQCISMSNAIAHNIGCSVQDLESYLIDEFGITQANATAPLSGWQALNQIFDTVYREHRLHLETLYNKFSTACDISHEDFDESKIRLMKKPMKKSAQQNSFILDYAHGTLRAIPPVLFSLLSEITKKDFSTPMDIHLSGQSLQFIPGSIELLKASENLTSLKITHTPNLIHLPTGLAQLVNLRQLEISHTPLAGFHPALKNLNKLEDLMLANNRLETLPTFIGSLSRLKKLDVSDNLLSTLPCDFKAPRYLKIGDNPLINLPPSKETLASILAALEYTENATWTKAYINGLMGKYTQHRLLRGPSSPTSETTSLPSASDVD